MKPNLRDDPSGFCATFTSVTVPPGPFFCEKCSFSRSGVTYDGRFFIIRRDMAVSKVSKRKGKNVRSWADENEGAEAHLEGKS